MKKSVFVSVSAVISLIMFIMITAAASEVYALTPYDAYKDGKIDFVDIYSQGTAYMDFSYAVSSEDELDIVSSDKTVFDTYYGDDFDQMDVAHNTIKYWYGIPVAPGTCTVTVSKKADPSDKWVATVTVKPEFFQNVLDEAYDFGPVEPVYDADDTPPVFNYTSEVGYGDKKVIVRAPYGAAAELYIADELVNSDVVGVSSRLDFSQDFLKKLKTPVKVVIKWAGATKEYNLTIVSKSSVKPARIKKNSKKGKVTVKKVHKGDYLKIKVGKKFVKTVKIKKDAKSQTISWANKKKMKKGTKVYYYLYNKYKQKLATAKTVVK